MHAFLKSRFKKLSLSVSALVTSSPSAKGLGKKKKLNQNKKYNTQNDYLKKGAKETFVNI